ncbi:MAG TPA: hypothetical protein VGS57_07120 [Thermoanaerobaculia bacterium]|jgi:hypothetical protein|nr:hypothetical protein [Thermoanaerobaculia bacterium]
MKRMLSLASLAAGLCALSVFATPASAERLYVPLVGGDDLAGKPLGTSVWVASDDGTSRQVASQALGKLGAPAAGHAAALLAFDGDAARVSAWLGADGSGDPVEVPVIGEHDLYAAGSSPALELAAFATTRVGAANIGDASATCRVELDGDSPSASARTFVVPPKSFAAIDLAPGTTDDDNAPSSAHVTCDQPFYPLAVSTGDDLQVVVAKGSGPNGSCDKRLNLTPQPDGSWLAAANGNFHVATTRHPKGVLCIDAPRELRVASAVYDWDVVAGPWWRKKKDGIHNLGYFFGERYRSGVIGNVNTIGTRNQLKFMQNYDMPPGSNTSVSGSCQMQKGGRYHVTYTFDAEHEQATLQLFRNGVEVKSLSQQTHPDGDTLLVQPYEGALALIAEFGNYDAKGLPEVPTVGWTYANFRLRLYPK